MDISDGFGKRLRRLRLERGLTQARLAEPYSAAFVSQIEAGRKLPSPTALRVFAKKLGVGAAELATGTSASVEAEINRELSDGWRALYLGDYATARKAFRAVQRLRRGSSLPKAGASAIVGEAWCSERQGDVTEALELFGRALKLARQALPAPSAVEAVAGMARCHQMLGEPTTALYLLERYLAELEQQELLDPTALMRTYASLVWPYMELGLNPKAYDVAARALRLQSRVDRPEEIASMHVNVARALLAKGEVDEAVESLERAAGIYRDLNWETEVARAELGHGILLLSEQRVVDARRLLDDALRSFRRVGFVREEARCLNELARASRATSDAAAAETYARQALELLTEMEAVPEQALAHREMALAVRDRDETAAERHLHKAIQLYEACGEIDHAADSYRLLGDLLERRQRHGGAGAYRAGLLLIQGRLGCND